MRYTNVFFDLDGTITEPFMGITNGIIYALKSFGIEVEDRNSLKSFIGPPLRVSFPEYFGFSKEETEKAVGLYREYYSVDGILENEIMPGMEKAFCELKEAGCSLYVATSKPELFAKQILENLKLEEYFDIIAGSSMDAKRDTKEEVLRYLLLKAGLDSEAEIKKTVMVGDRMYDVCGAKAVGMDCIGVLFGYGSKEELLTAGARYIAKDAQEMTDIVLGKL